VQDGPVSVEALGVAASLALASRHPYARAITTAARERGIAPSLAGGVREVAGAGMETDGPAGRIRLGSASFCCVEDDGNPQPALWLKRPAMTPIAFRFEEALRSGAAATIAELKRAGYGIEILSGDRIEPVAAAAGAAGIAHFRGQQKPDAKLARLGELQRQGRKVLMVGDGLNDAPALAAGHASLSPSTAADISQTVADAVMQGERLHPLIEILTVAKAVRRRALENFAIALGYNVVFVPLAVVGFVTPLIAAIAMSASSIAVTANAMRLGMRGRAPKEKKP
jgi:P-type Cu2+ transporter